LHREARDHVVRGRDVDPARVGDAELAGGEAHRHRTYGVRYERERSIEEGAEMQLEGPSLVASDGLDRGDGDGRASRNAYMPVPAGVGSGEVVSELELGRRQGHALQRSRTR